VEGEVETGHHHGEDTRGFSELGKEVGTVAAEDGHWKREEMRRVR
jgi:hypothetical protein